MSTKPKEIKFEDFDFAPGELKKLVLGARELAKFPDDETYEQIERAGEESAATDTE